MSIIQKGKILILLHIFFMFKCLNEKDNIIIGVSADKKKTEKPMLNKKKKKKDKGKN